jgi:hypothetical protein
MSCGSQERKRATPYILAEMGYGVVDTGNEGVEILRENRSDINCGKF